jgi:hypothetical protein
MYIKSALDWFRSYHNERSQTFCFSGTQSVEYILDCSVPQGSVLGPVEFIAYTEDVVDIFNHHNLKHHVYADDKQMYTGVSIAHIDDARTALQNCVHDVYDWCASRRLQLNADKTELIWFGSSTNLKKLSTKDCNLYLGDTCVRPSSTVRDLGVQLDNELSLQSHINKVACGCYYHIRRLRQVKRCLDEDILKRLVSALILSRLDYCNSILASLPQSSLSALQRVQNAAARLVLGLRPRDHISSGLKQLHWLPVAFRIQFKLCTMMYLANAGQTPHYISEMLCLTASTQRRSGLRSAETLLYTKPRLRTKHGERAFSFAGPNEWNALPARLQTLPTLNSFKKELKTLLFCKAFETCS